jgi:hypothetical protein
MAEESYAPEDPPPLLQGAGYLDFSEPENKTEISAKSGTKTQEVEQLSLDLGVELKDSGAARDFLPPDSYAETLGGGIPERKHPRV